VRALGGLSPAASPCGTLSRARYVNIDWTVNRQGRGITIAPDSSASRPRRVARYANIDWTVNRQGHHHCSGQLGVSAASCCGLLAVRCPVLAMRTSTGPSTDKAGGSPIAPDSSASIVPDARAQSSTSLAARCALLSCAALGCGIGGGARPRRLAAALGRGASAVHGPRRRAQSSTSCRLAARRALLSCAALGCGIGGGARPRRSAAVLGGGAWLSRRRCSAAALGASCCGTSEGRRARGPGR
jgi:hypothetical protein